MGAVVGLARPGFARTLFRLSYGFFPARWRKPGGAPELITGERGARGVYPLLVRAVGEGGRMSEETREGFMVGIRTP